MEKVAIYLLEKYGIYGVLIVSSLYIIFKHSGVIINKVLDAKIGRAISHNTRFILNSKLTYWIELKIPTMELREHVRTIMFSDLLIIKFTLFKERLFKIEDSEGFDELDKSVLYEKLVTCISGILHQCEVKARSDGIPDVVIEKYKEHHKSTFNYFIMSMESLIMSDLYKTNKSRIDVFYILLVSFLQTSIIDAESVVEQLNGSLTGKIYKGRVIGKFPR